MERYLRLKGAVCGDIGVMRRSALSPLSANMDSGSAVKRRTLGEVPLQSYDTDPNYCFPSIPAYQIINGDDVSAHLHGDRSCRRYSVVYGRVSTRKHKRWEGDGILVCQDRFALLQTEDGKDVARVNAFSRKHLESLEPGSHLVIGGFELEVQQELDSADERRFLSATLSNESSSLSNTSSASSDRTMRRTSERSSSCVSNAAVRRNFVPPLICAQESADSCVFLVSKKGVDKNDDGDVFLDCRLAHHLRPHQMEGVIFLYERLKDAGGGVILADEMGLGKSVQAISLMWILLQRLKQQGATILKFILITPTSLVDNWRCEFNKWLPQSSSLQPFPITKASEVSKFAAYCSYYPVLLISYEMAIRCAEQLGRSSFALMICDEAHRLKNHNGHLRLFISRLRTERRLLLTGTPLQNDLNEFFSLLDIAKPGHFGSLAEFKDMLENENDDCDVQLLLSDVMLRRTADVIYSCLPPKHEYILWCRLSNMQRILYSRILEVASVDHLAMIDMLRKLCNHPTILYQSLTSKHNVSNAAEGSLNELVLRAFPPSFEPDSSSIADSGKLIVFIEIMVSLRETNEKIVVVSNFTRTLDMLMEVCKGLFFTVTRLDGSVMANKRMQLVNEFNKSSLPNHVFLLSTKAGGVGLNLVGASRLVLFDSDWNPAFDVQAMARIWRDGQKMPCHIYRLVTAGAIDEKVLQRQVQKSGLSTIVDFDMINEPMTRFSDEDLTEIFMLDEQTACGTHELMKCDCGGCGLLPAERDKQPNEGNSTERARSPAIDDFDSLTEKTKESSEFDGSVSVFKHIERSYLEGEDEQPQSDISDAARICVQKSEGNDVANAAEKTLSASLLMGALMRWRHYSPECKQQFEGERLLDSESSEFDGSVSVFKHIERSYLEGEDEQPQSDISDAARICVQKSEGNDVANAAEKTLSASLLMGALMRWRHYSPECKQQFEMMKADAGFSQTPLPELTFVMKLTSNC
ncbi:DNA repair and recombination protein RAD54B [Toxocara canis]|uniref:DNA repair and recombination protein RAD54-like n=1 Tax=Toxocara canis TaxID=6265 RepID=A0A0B2VLB9_TOXCA|nr:DNA repair and recombination protein RAD54B [Toxocara canis]